MSARLTKELTVIDETRRAGFTTRAVHAGEAPDPATGAVGVPIYQNATFAFRSAEQIDRFNEGDVPHYIYTRYGNPTVRCLELKLAALEGAEDVLVAASGMAAISTVALHFLAGGGHVVASDTLYPIAREFFRDSLGDYGGSATMVDATDLDAVRAAIGPDTRAIHVETFTNPTLQVMEIPALAKIAHGAGIALIVDNTFLSPALYRPLEDGAAVVIHSATKYLSGHGNLLGGVIAGSADTIAAMRHRMEQLGGIMTPQNAWQLTHGVKTLALRMHQHSESAMAVAGVMAGHPAIEQVNYPGLPDHPGHGLAARKTGGRYSGMISLRLVDHARSRNVFLDALTIPYRAVSLGDTASLVWPFDDDGVIRLSVGIEDTEDLVADVRRALDAVSARLGVTMATAR
jgi:cystathionine beta-lyase/cystathionine gamma-synthase